MNSFNVNLFNVIHAMHVPKHATCYVIRNCVDMAQVCQHGPSLLTWLSFVLTWLSFVLPWLWILGCLPWNPIAGGSWSTGPVYLKPSALDTRTFACQMVGWACRMVGGPQGTTQSKTCHCTGMCRTVLRHAPNLRVTGRRIWLVSCVTWRFAHPTLDGAFAGAIR